MGLINCKIVGEIVLEQTPGVGDIASYELYIEPDDGHVIAAQDFTDNTFDTFSSYVNGIIDFGDTGKLEMVDTVAAYGTDNKVKITVNLYPDYSIAEDTTITIDIDGTAFFEAPVDWTLRLADLINPLVTNPYTFTIVPETDINMSATQTLGDLGDSSIPDSMYSNNYRDFTARSVVDVEIKIATGIVQAAVHLTNPATYGFYIRYNGAAALNAINMAHVGLTGSGFRLEVDESSSELAEFEEVGEKYVKQQFDLFYKPSSANPIDAIDFCRLNVIKSLATAFVDPLRQLVVSNITTNLGSLPSGSFNVIPSSGITLSDTPIVKVYGTPGARFKVELVESRVVEGLSDNRSTNTGAVDYFGGIIPDMPVGLAIVPKNGVYSFKMPTIASHTGTGWKEFEMKVTAEPGTTIGPRAVKVGGKSTNIGLSKSTVTNKFYQYPKVNIEFEVVLPDALGAYEGVYTSDNQLPNFGGTGSGKYGVPMMPPSSDSRLPDSTRTINFEIRLRKLGGAFSLSETFSKSHFVATEIGNRDLVSFSKLKARIGAGLSDTTSTAATVFGTIKCDRFGFVNQTYTLDLSKILTFA